MVSYFHLIDLNQKYKLQCNCTHGRYFMKSKRFKSISTLALLLFSLLSHSNPLPEEYQRYVERMGEDPQTLVKELLAKEIDSKNLEKNALNKAAIAQTYSVLVYPQKAIDYADEGLFLLVNNKPEWLYYRLLMIKSQAMDIRGFHKEALPIAKNVVEWAEKNGDDSFKVDAYAGLGFLEQTLGNSLSALDAFMKTYKISASSPDLAQEEAASGIAWVYEQRREYDLAIPYYQESVDFQRDKQNLLDLSISLYGLGRSHALIGNLEIGKKHILESFDISKSINDEQGIAYALKELAYINVKQNNLSEAQTQYDESIKLFSKSQNQGMLFEVNRSNAELQLIKNDITQAQISLDLAKQNSNANLSPSQEISLEEIQSKIIAANGDYESAYKKLVNTVSRKQALFSEKSTRVLHELRTKFELDEQKYANHVLEQQNSLQSMKLLEERQRNHLLIIAIVAATIIVFLLFLFAIKTRRQKKQLYNFANFDSLTGLPNRSHIFRKLERIQKKLAPSQKLTIGMLDLDHFKLVNDRFGHQKGDIVLDAIGIILKENISNPHFAGRLGGEEFILVFIETEQEEILSIIEKIKHLTKDIHTKVDPQCPPVTFSVGLSLGLVNNSIKEQFRAADLAMYEAKHTGRNQTVIATDQHHKESQIHIQTLEKSS